ncbi:MAG: hypothetical protein AB8B95_02720 [Pseudohongiellaceae bacterium]
MKEDTVTVLLKFLRQVQVGSRKILKWLFFIITLLTVIAAVMIFSGNIVADLTLDSGAPLNPYLALIGLSAAVYALLTFAVLAALLLIELSKCLVKKLRE